MQTDVRKVITRSTTVALSHHLSVSIMNRNVHSMDVQTYAGCITMIGLPSVNASGSAPHTPIMSDQVIMRPSETAGHLFTGASSWSRSPGERVGCAQP